MIATLAIQTALAAFLRDSLLVDAVTTHTDPDLGNALEALRDTPDSLIVIVPGADTIKHDLTPGSNSPEFAELSCAFELLITSRDLAMGPSGDPAALELKDAVIARLMWDSLGIDGLLCLPTTCEPFTVVFDAGRGRESWKLSLVVRQLIF